LASLNHFTVPCSICFLIFLNVDVALVNRKVTGRNRSRLKGMAAKRAVSNTRKPIIQQTGARGAQKQRAGLVRVRILQELQTKGCTDGHLGRVFLSRKVHVPPDRMLIGPNLKRSRANSRLPDLARRSRSWPERRLRLPSESATPGPGMPPRNKCAAAAPCRKRGPVPTPRLHCRS